MQSPASQGRFDDDLVTQVQWNTLVRKGDEVTMRLIYETVPSAMCPYKCGIMILGVSTVLRERRVGVGP